jgi:hypothetical protein
MKIELRTEVTEGGVRSECNLAVETLHKTKTSSVAFCLQAKYTDRAPAAAGEASDEFSE